MMKFSMPTNWDDRIVELARLYPVYTVYASLDRDPFGGGQPAQNLPRVSRDRLARHVADLRAIDVPFTYLLNAPCIGNRDYTQKGRRQIIDFVRFLVDIGVEYVTVTIPHMVDLIRKYAPSLSIRISTFAVVDSVQKARYYEEIGASDITLDVNINRDFRLLRAIRRAVRLDLSVIVNDFCLLRCPMMSAHSSIIGHASQTDTDGDYVDTYTMFCKPRMLERPVEMIRSPWIRPEDLERYEAIGIHHFKLAGRSKGTEYIERAIGAYSKRRYDGNLLDLLESVKTKIDDEQWALLDSLLNHVPRLTRAAFSTAAALLGLLDRSDRVNQFSFLSKLPAATSRCLLSAFHELARANGAAHIDNRALDGFLDRFEKEPCLDCEMCDYCDKWTERAVRTNPELTARAVARAAETLEAWRNGGR